MEYTYRKLNHNYLISEIFSNGWKYGIVDKNTGVEYIAPICNFIRYHEDAQLLEFEIESKSKYWHILCHINKFDEFVAKQNIINRLN